MGPIMSAFAIYGLLVDGRATGSGNAEGRVVTSVGDGVTMVLFLGYFS